MSRAFYNSVEANLIKARKEFEEAKLGLHKKTVLKEYSTEKLDKLVKNVIEEENDSIMKKIEDAFNSSIGDRKNQQSMKKPDYSAYNRMKTKSYNTGGGASGAIGASGVSSEVRKPNTKLMDTDWDDFFGDLVVPKEKSLEERIREEIMKPFKDEKYHGRQISDTTIYGEMIGDAIISYHKTLEESKKAKQEEEEKPNWCVIKD